MIMRRLRVGLIACVAALSMAAVSAPAHAARLVVCPTNHAPHPPPPAPHPPPRHHRQPRPVRHGELWGERVRVSCSWGGPGWVDT